MNRRAHPPTEVEVSFTVPAPNVPDGDYSADFREAGTTMTAGGVLTSEPISIQKAVVRDGELTVTGVAAIALDPPTTAPPLAN